MTASIWIYAISALSMVGVLAQPWRLPEAVWAVGGAALLVLGGFVGTHEAALAIGKGLDVYMFLVGMMLLSELARREGLFDYVAALCVRASRGSSQRLFLCVYGVGTVVTVFMSNDATAVVLTPAVLAVARKARAAPLPYLLACAFIANAASFVLPISNPANLVIFGDKLPALGEWFGRFALASALSIIATYVILRLMFRRELVAVVEDDIDVPALPTSGRVAAAGILATAAVLLVASSFGVPLGLPTMLVALAVCLVVLVRKREAPWALARHVSWSVLALVAGLFVLVQGLQAAGLLADLTALLRQAEAASVTWTAMGSAVILAYACNLLNNLPAGLIASSVASGASVHPLVHSALTIGVDLGPNLSVTGSLATILWLVAIRREGEHVSAWTFLKSGLVAMPVALVASLGGLWLSSLVGAG